MSKVGFMKVEGHESLVRDINSKAIVNTNTTEYEVYMTRHRARNEQSDQIRNACKEINNLKSELREIKGLIGKLVNGS
tara:strand:+ start:41 stop:274 length:234 start_codon:yes stop_codon:yes gene_type:complete